MPTTRSTHLMRRVLGLAAVPVLMLSAAACGGDDDDSADGGDGGGGDSSSFCDDVRALEDTFGDPNSADQETFAEAMEAFTQLDPPAAIAEDWELMVGALEGTPAEGDIADVEAASDRVDTYMADECGIDG
jgi:hypothetical protein